MLATRQNLADPPEERKSDMCRDGKPAAGPIRLFLFFAATVAACVWEGLCISRSSVAIPLLVIGFPFASACSFWAKGDNGGINSSCVKVWLLLFIGMPACIVMTFAAFLAIGLIFGSGNNSATFANGAMIAAEIVGSLFWTLFLTKASMGRLSTKAFVACLTGLGLAVAISYGAGTVIQNHFGRDRLWASTVTTITFTSALIFILLRSNVRAAHILGALRGSEV